ncbi:MAG: hypothetical protein JNJ70_24820 [Verrucomicrobiales bacterium]|nr:hypothetical protein [Verrucomicrobiales bacterium]
MPDPDDEELLEAIRKNREAREIRREAIEFLRARTVRNIPRGIFLFALSAVYGFGSNWMDSEMDRELSAYDMTMRGVVVMFVIWMGIRQFAIDPRDRLLLLLAEESQAKDPPIFNGTKKDEAGLS